MNWDNFLIICAYIWLLCGVIALLGISRSSLKDAKEILRRESVLGLVPIALMTLISIGICLFMGGVVLAVLAHAEVLEWPLKRSEVVALIPFLPVVTLLALWLI